MCDTKTIRCLNLSLTQRSRLNSISDLGTYRARPGSDKKASLEYNSIANSCDISLQCGAVFGVLAPPATGYGPLALTSRKSIFGSSSSSSLAGVKVVNFLCGRFPKAVHSRSVLNTCCNHRTGQTSNIGF